MPEPFTIGALVAAALAAGASEAGKGVLGALAKDAYAALKSTATRALGPAVRMLEGNPASPDLAKGIAAEVDGQPDLVQAELRALAEGVRAALESEGRGAAMTSTLNQFNAYGGEQYNAPGGTINVDRRKGGT